MTARGGIYDGPNGPMHGDGKPVESAPMSTQPTFRDVIERWRKFKEGVLSENIANDYEQGFTVSRRGCADEAELILTRLAALSEKWRTALPITHPLREIYVIHADALDAVIGPFPEGEAKSGS